MTPHELADRYNGKVTIRTLANWRSAGISPPFTKVGGRIFYRLEDIEQWERNRTVSSTSDYSRR
jgi:DNA-binding transcriptional MerR regulator